MAYEYRYVIKCRDEVLKLAEKKVYCLVLHKHLGDVFYAIGLKDQFKKTYGSELSFVVRPQHEFLMKLWGCTDYVVYDLDRFVKKNKGLITSYFQGRVPEKDELDSLENNIFQSLFPGIPSKNLPFVCETPINNFFSYPMYWCYRWSSNIGLKEDFYFYPKKVDLRLSENALRALDTIGPLEDCVFLAPEAKTSFELPIEIWTEIADTIRSSGYKVLVNSKRIKIKKSQSLYDFKLTLEDVVAIAFKCHSIISLRSGICDVLVTAGKKLTVITPAMLFRERGSLSVPFGGQSQVQEVILTNWNCSKFLWNDIDLTRKIQKTIDKFRLIYWKEKLLSIITSSRNKSSDRSSDHKFWKWLFNNLFGNGKIFPDNNIQAPNVSKIFKLFGVEIYVSDRKNDDEGVVIERRIFKYFYREYKSRLKRKYYLLGIEILSIKDRKKHIVKFLGVPVFWRSRKQDFFNYLAKNLDKKNIKNSNIIVLRHNIGENSIYFSVLNEWIKKENLRNPSVLIWRNKDKRFLSIFCGGTLPIIEIPIAQSDLNCFLVDEKYKIDSNTLHTPTFKIAERMKIDFETDKNVNFVGYICSSLNLNNYNPRLPSVSDQTKQYIANFHKQVFFDRHFILVCPDATSLKPIPVGVWRNIVSQLVLKGYMVAVNSDIDIDSRAINVRNLGVDQIYELATRASGIISLASGLSVLLTFTKVNMDLIYTDFRSRSIGYDAVMAKSIYSVTNLHISDDNVREYIYDVKFEHKLQTEILNRY